MTRLPVPPIAPEIVDKIRQSIQTGKPREEVFAEMRQSGLFIGYSIKLTQELYGIPLGEAKRAVHFSETWADCLESNNATHEAAFEAARQFGFEEVDVLEDSSHGIELQDAR